MSELLLNDELMDAYINEVMIKLHNDLDIGSSPADIEVFLDQYSEEQIDGVMNHVKGHFAERLYVDYENNDGDSIFATLNDDPRQAGYDIELEDIEIGEEWFVQVKATDNTSYVQSAIDKYPDIEVVATEEVAKELGLEDIGYSNQEIEDEVMRYFEEKGQIDSSHASTPVVAFPSGMEDVFNVCLTGGFYAVLDMLSDQPEKQKKVIQASIAVGLLDGFVDFDALSLENGFDMNPLLVASLVSAMVHMGIRSERPSIKKVSSSVAIGLTKTMKVVEYGSYAALGAGVIDLLTGLESLEFLGEAVEVLDIFDLVDGVDLVDGLMGLGFGIAASKAIKKFMDQYNKKDREEIKDLLHSTTARDLCRSLLKDNVPAPVLIGAYKSFGGY